jgi:glycosyltransferase involved in cell wall biosynthesis
MNLEEDFPSLIFVGNMATGSSTEAILHFYNEMYALIKKEIPNIKLYIVGKDPSQKILQLASDTSVIITGYVEDVRPYLARASVVIEPITVAMGIRTRVLEALAMGKPVVATSFAVGGIDITPNDDIIIADNPNEFVERVIQLLNDEELRGRIGKNARKLVEKKYSWEIMSEKFHKVLILTTK